MEHHQLFEFIEVFQHYHKSTGTKVLPLHPASGLTFLHLAVEHSSLQILAYMLLDLKMDPNVLSRDQKTILHMAIEKQEMQMLDIILMSEPNIN